MKEQNFNSPSKDFKTLTFCLVYFGLHYRFLFDLAKADFPGSKNLLHLPSGIHPCLQIIVQTTTVIKQSLKHSAPSLWTTDM